MQEMRATCASEKQQLPQREAAPAAERQQLSEPGAASDEQQLSEPGAAAATDEQQLSELGSASALEEHQLRPRKHAAKTTSAAVNGNKVRSAQVVEDWACNGKAC